MQCALLAWAVVSFSVVFWFKLTNYAAFVVAYLERKYDVGSTEAAGQHLVE